MPFFLVEIKKTKSPCREWPYYLLIEDVYTREIWNMDLRLAVLPSTGNSLKFLALDC